MNGYKSLAAWQKSMELTNAVYKNTSNYPEDEKFGLVSQIRRSAVSIPSNIAEGSARQSHKDFIRFINIAKGSLAELETQLIISNHQNYISSDILEDLTIIIKEVDKIINFLRKSLKNKLEAA